MIDYDLNNNFSDFITDTHKFFKEFNRCNPAEFEVENEDRPWVCAIFLLSQIASSLKNIENVVIHKIENG
jgi:hypothetical protein